MKIVRRTGVQLDRRSSIIVLALVGVLFLAIGGYFLHDTITVLRDGISANAEIINILARRDNNRNNYTPEVSFTTLDGQTVRTLLSTSSSSSTKYSIGNKVKVIYLPDKLESVMENSLFGKYGFPLIFCGGGIVLVGAALSIFLKR